MQTLSTIAPIISAVAMITLAVFTYLSVRIMRKDSNRTNRPVVYSDELVSLSVEGDELGISYNVVNCGKLPGCISKVVTYINHELPNNVTDDPREVAIFPGQQLRYFYRFDKSTVIRENRVFDIQIEIDYRDLTDEKSSYHYLIHVEVIAEDDSDGNLKVISSLINECK